LVEITLRGATVKEASMKFLSHSDIHAHNTFDQHDVVVPQTKPLTANGRTLMVEFPPASVAALNIQLS
jgi:alpha-L-arabinofuranosidase